MPLTRLNLEERIRCVRFFSMYEKTSHIQKAWRKECGTDPPSRKTIAALNKKFNETGSVADLSRSGRPKSSRTEEKVALVEAALKKDPTRSIRSLSSELGVNKAAVHRIKKDAEKKKNTLKIENKKLKEKVSEMKKKIDTLENRLAAANGNSTELIGNKSPKIEEITTSTVSISIDPTNNVNTQVLHLQPHEVVQVVQVQQQPQTQLQQDMNQHQMQHQQQLQTCQIQQHPIPPDCTMCTYHLNLTTTN